jgi:protein subunit release factor B
MKKEKLFSITKKDFEVQTFRAGGKGGQNQNKRNTGVRIIHKESGIRAECREERSQGQNKKIAFRRLINDPKFKLWINIKSKEIINNKKIEEIVEKQMNPENLKIEFVSEDGKWEEGE